MSFKDCQTNNSLREECLQLLNSVTDFKLYAVQSLRLAISGRLTTPLYLTLHRGSCNHSCEGGFQQDCPTDKEHYTWQNVSSPFVLENYTFIKPSLYYCITAKISDNNCCPVCTHTSFMEGVEKSVSSSLFDDSLWNVIILISVIILLFGFGIFLSHMHRKAQTSGRPRSSGSADVPLNNCEYKVIETRKRTEQKQVVCLYIREESQFFLETINALQSSLRERGLNVIDIYQEEENIFKSIIRWTQGILRNPDIKMILVDTSPMRQLWKRDLESGEVYKATDRAILYISECVTSHSLYNKWFVVRFQEDCGGVSDDMIHLTNGRRYIYPDQQDRLAYDIMVRNT